MSIPEAAPGDDIQRAKTLLMSAAKPLSFSQLKKSLRLSDPELKTLLEAAVAQSAVFRWPDYRKSQYFWSKPADISAQEVIMVLASAEALSRTTLISRSCRQVKGFSQQGMDRIVKNLIASGELQTVPAFTSGKLLIRAGIAAPYVAAARKFIEEKFRKASLSPAELFSSAPTVSAATQETSSDLPRRILDLLRSIEPIIGVPVTTQRLRQKLPEITKQDFDSAALELRKLHEVSLSLHHDPHNLSEVERDILIDGQDGAYYVAIAIRR